MFRERMQSLFRSRDHKRIMLVGLYSASILILAMLTLMALGMGYPALFYFKLTMTLLLTLLFLAFCRSRNTPLFAILFLLLMEIESSSAMIDPHFYNFATVYPFFHILGFFFFFRLKTAAWMTVGHFIYWGAVSAYGLKSFVGHPLFHMVPLLNMFMSSILVVFIALFYHISTEMTYAELERSNRQKEILLKEIHHRIKNNLNRIASLLGLQILSLRHRNADPPETALQKSKLRIEAMAMVHDALYRSNDLERIDFAIYARQLLKLIGQAFGRPLPFQLEVHDGALPLDRMLKIGMILNELYTNSLKYATEHPQHGLKVVITLTHEAEEYRLTYHQRNHREIDLDALEKSPGLGMKLIRLAAGEIHGSLDLANDRGLRVTLTFPA